MKIIKICANIFTHFLVEKLMLWTFTFPIC